MEVLLGARHRDIEEPALLLDLLGPNPATGVGTSRTPQQFRLDNGILSASKPFGLIRILPPYDRTRAHGGDKWIRRGPIYKGTAIRRLASASTADRMADRRG